MDGAGTHRADDVLRIYVRGCDVPAQISHRRSAGLGQRGVRDIRRGRIHIECVRIPDHCRNHSGQDGSEVHGNPVRIPDGHRRRHKIYRDKRLVPDHRILRLARQLVDRNAGKREDGVPRIHDIRLRMRNGWDHGIQGYRQMVQGQGNGPGNGT